MLSIALRNVARHAAHSAVLAALFALTSFLFISGNSLLANSNRVLRRLFVDTITADVVLAAPSDQSMSIFGANTPAIGELIPIPLLSHKERLVEAVTARADVEAVTPLVSGVALLDVSGSRRTVPVFGIEAESYFPVLAGLELTAGRIPQAGERGILLTRSLLQRIERETGSAIEPGAEILLTTGQEQRFRIRALPLIGVYRHPAALDYLADIALVDAATVRELNTIQHRIVAADDDPRAADTGPQRVDDIDSLFGSAESADAQSAAAADPEAYQSPEPTEPSEAAGLRVDDVLALVHAERDRVAPVAGAAHFLLVRGRDSAALRQIAADHGAQVLSWRQAAGQVALLALLLLVLFNGGFLLFTIAVALGATNIVLISTYRRTREIGTLRAIGAEDSAVRFILITEHALIGLLGWLGGLLATVGLSLYLRRAELAVNNRLLAMLLGGESLQLPIDAPSTALGLGIVVGVACCAALLPLARAMRKPVVAAIHEGR